MDLYLIRHAEAVSRDDAQYKDEERPLTEKGREQARALARSLLARKIHFDDREHAIAALRAVSGRAGRAC